MIKKILMVCLCFIMVGCTSSDVEEDMDNVENTIVHTEGDYSIITPHQVSMSRYWHGDYLARYDAIKLPKNLKERSKEFFSVKSNLLSSGLILNKEDIITLQKRNSEENNYSLNMSGEFKVNDVMSVIDPYIVYDIVELDFYDINAKDQLNGISLAVVMHSSVSDDNGSYDLSNDILYEYASSISDNLYNYLVDVKQVDCPIYITYFASSEENATLPGVFIGEKFYKNQKINEKKINEKWAYYPSELGRELDSDLYAKFNLIKSGLHNFIPESTDIIGLAHFMDDQCVSLEIDVNTQAKTYTEIDAMANYLNQLLKASNMVDIEVVVEIKMFDDTYFIIKKDARSHDTIVIDVS